MFLVSHTKREYTHSSSSISNKTHNYILLFVCFMHTPKRTVMGQKSVASNISIIYYGQNNTFSRGFQVCVCKPK